MKPDVIETASEQPPYTDAHIATYPVEYIAGIDLYNAGEFHAAHDAWEERWMGEVGAQEIGAVANDGVEAGRHVAPLEQ